MAHVHPTAIVGPGAELDESVCIGPYSIVGNGVRLGRGCVLHSHVQISGPTEVGEDCEFFSFSVVGARAQHRNDRGEGGRLVMGARNVVREHVTIHRGTESGTTRLGSDNLLMVACHIAHDVVVGSHVAIANGVQLAGHAVVEDYATFGGLSGVAQFVRVGESAFVAAGAMCEREVPPYVIVQGDRAVVRALNRVGLSRRNFTDEELAPLERAYRLVFVQKRVPRVQAIKAVDSTNPLVVKLLASLQRTEAK